MTYTIIIHIANAEMKSLRSQHSKRRKKANVGDDCLRDQEAAALTAILIAAMCKKNRPVERAILKCLNHEYNIRLQFADDLAKKEAK
jgi:hypothetical protein